MIDSLLQDLQDPDPQVRGEAIIRLANLGDRNALPALAAVHRNDPDPRLRELALKAGRHIQLNAPQSEAPAGTPPPAPKTVAPHERARARSLLDAAAGYHIGGEHARAIESLGRALDIDPALSSDGFATNLAAALTGLPRTEAVAVVEDPARRAALIEEAGGKKKKRRPATPDADDTQDATWGSVLIDALLYALVAALSMAAIFVLSLDMLKDLYTSLPPGATTGSLTADELDLLTHTDLAVLLPFALISGLYGAVALLFQGAAIHFAAITFFGGMASLVTFYRRFIPFQTGVTLAYAAVFIAIALLGSGIEPWIMLSAAGMLGSIIVFYLLAELVSKVYRFSWWSGCGTIVIGGLVLAAISFVGTMILTWLLGTLIGAVV